MSPQTGDIWEYTYEYSETDPIAVLVMEKSPEWEDTWLCLRLDDGECNDWLFDEECAPRWRKLA